MDHFVPLGHSDPLCKRVWKCKCKTTAPSGNPLFLESRKEAGTGKFMKKKVNCQPGVQAEKNQRHGKDPRDLLMGLRRLQGREQFGLENFFESLKCTVAYTLLPGSCLEQARQPWNADWLDFYRVKFQQANLAVFLFKRGILFC